ncbi:ankyrin repeat domain-containing protein 29-like isoform X3 [Halichondria panicea]|uniref:ankyrin repeat domain-containing protein 29-like isoform X3 n=1 Tax=Halichondria panicea TaxID=6063 RepID=UPI00312BABFA
MQATCLPSLMRNGPSTLPSWTSSHSVISSFTLLSVISLKLTRLLKVFTTISTVSGELVCRNTAVHGDKMGQKHALYPLVVSCLHDRPQQRPSVDEVVVSLRKLCLQHPRMAFLDACETDNVGVVLELLECGADPNQADKDGATALYWASRNGHDEIVRVLLAAKATVNTQTKSGQTPLWTTSFSGHQKCMELLIDAGADVDVPKDVSTGATALIAAAWNGHVRAVELLIAAKAQVDIQHKVRFTAFKIIWICNNVQSGETPLWVASFKGHQKCMELLIDAGANVDVPRENGCTAYDLASGNGHTQVCELLH